MIAFPPQPACRVCGATERQRLLSKNGLPIVRCLSCGLVYVDAQIDTAELAERYGAAYYGGDVFHDYLGERDERVAGARNQCELLAQLQPAGRLLDVGCAAGFFLHAASERWDVTGVELSPFAADHARREFGLRVLTGDIADVALADASFDIVTLWNTIEHVANPQSVIEQVARVAAPGALVVISTGNVMGPQAKRDLAGWNLMTPPEHLYFFDPRTISLLLERAGLTVRRITHDGLVVPSGVLAAPRLRALMSILTGNVMTVYARREASARMRPGPVRRLERTFRPVGRV